MTIPLLEIATHVAGASLAQTGFGVPDGGASASTGPAGGEALMLVSWYKPLLMIIAVVAWAWVIATVYDKDAERWYLNRKAWNLGHMTAGIVGVAAVLLLPSFWIGFPVLLVILLADLGAYALTHNRSERVPEAFKWSLDLTKMKEARAARDKLKLQKNVSLEFRGPNGVVDPPPKDSPEYEIRVVAEQILIDAVTARASRLDFAPTGDGQNYGLVFLIDGVRQARDPVPAPQAIAAIDFLKDAAGLDTADRRRRLRADLAMEQAGGRRTLRLTSMGGSSGLRLNVVFDPESQVRFDIPEFGLLEPQRKALEALVKEGQGAVLVGAPPVNGRTSTLYGLLRAHDPYTSNVQTVEIEPQDNIEGVRHNIFNPLEDGSEYSTTVRSILRRDPDVVAIAELPDAATAIEVTKADHERTRTYIGLRADSALAAIQTYMKAVGDTKLAAPALHGVITQRLIRKLCKNCRVEYQPTPELVKKIGGSPDKVSKLYKKGGQVLIRNKPETCPVCSGTGFFGQEGIFEIFPIDQADRALISSGDLAGLRGSLRKKQLPSIQEAAIAKAIKGVTSVEEVVRVTSPPKQKPKQ